MGWKSKHQRTTISARSEWKRGLSIAFAVATTFAFTGVGAQASDPNAWKCDKVIRTKLSTTSSKKWSNVIIKFDGALTSAQKSSLETLDGTIVRQFKAIDSATIKIPTKNLSKLAALKWVHHVSHDFTVMKADDFTTNHTFAQQGWNLSGGPFQGANVNIAIVDSGIQRAQDFSGSSFSSRLLHSQDFSSHSSDVPSEAGLLDPCGHGTHVAGIAAGNAKSSSGLNATRSFWGQAPKSGLIGVRVLERDGSGTTTNVLAGLQWVLDNKTTWNIKVVNLSLGHPVGESSSSDPLCLMVESLWRNGITVVCAAGNMGRLNPENKPDLDNEGWGTAYGSIQVPANSPYVITVGAMKRMSSNLRADDKVATYSSRGPTIFDYCLKPDLVAPGNLVVSVGPSDGYLFQNHSANMLPKSQYLLLPSLARPTDNGYYRLSGTSMAAPVVAGTAAMMLNKEPWLTPDTIKARLMISADKWEYPNPGSDGDGDGAEFNGTDPCTFGAGFLNVSAAMVSTVSVDAGAHALSPMLVLDANGNLTINWEGISYGNRAVWGTGITDLRAIWGFRAVWGTNIGGVGGLRAVWGLEVGRVENTRAVWGNTLQVEADRAVWGNQSPTCDLTSIALAGE